MMHSYHFRLFLLSNLLILLMFKVWAQPQATLGKTLVSSSIWDENPVIGTSTQQNGIAAYKNFVYVVYYNADRNMCISRNSNYGEGDTWVTVVLPHTYEMRNGTWDNHNTPNIAISPSDERIHLSFDMHARDLRYIISSESAATVSDALFKADLFSSTRAYLQQSQVVLTRVTYPRFFIDEDNDLFFMYRKGGSGNGDSFLVRYRNDGFWDAPIEIIDGNIGSYNGHGDRCAYFNNVHVKGEKIYLTWVWRETSNGATNHDLMFAYTDDKGQTWKNSSGTAIAKPMTLNSSGIKVATIATNTGLANHNGATVDGDGNIHVVLRIDGSYIHHFGKRDGDRFTWTEQVIDSFSGDRPKIYSDQKTNDLYFLVRQGNSLRLYATASNGGKWDQWSQVQTDSHSYMTSTNSFMNEAGDVLTSMVVSSGVGLHVLRWSLSTDSPEIVVEEETVLGFLPEDNFAIYANPSPTGIFQLPFETEFKVYNMQGEIVLSGKGVDIDLSGFQEGVYLLNANGETYKLVRL